MTPDQLKAELAQMAVENQLLREGLGKLTTEDAVSHAEGCIEDDAERRPKSHNPQAVKFYDEFGMADLFAIDFIAAKVALQTPPTPGLGAAMLKVVEAATALAAEDVHDPVKQWALIEAVQALKELEESK